MVSLSFPMQEVGLWVKSSMISCEVSLLAIVFSLAKALACPAARQMTIFLLILLLLSLGRSSFCNWANEELMFPFPTISCTSQSFLHSFFSNLPGCHCNRHTRRCHDS